MGGGMVRLNKGPRLLIYRKGDLEILFPICVDDSLFITNSMDDAKAVLDEILTRFKGRVEGIPGKFLGTSYAMD